MLRNLTSIALVYHHHPLPLPLSKLGSSHHPSPQSPFFPQLRSCQSIISSLPHLLHLTSSLTNNFCSTDQTCPAHMAPVPVPSSTDTTPAIWDPRSTPYPTARRDKSAKETFKSKIHGEVEIADPYHWLHEPPSQSEETQVSSMYPVTPSASCLTS